MELSYGRWNDKVDTEAVFLAKKKNKFVKTKNQKPVKTKFYAIITFFFFFFYTFCDVIIAAIVWSLIQVTVYDETKPTAPPGKSEILSVFVSLPQSVFLIAWSSVSHVSYVRLLAHFSPRCRKTEILSGDSDSLVSLRWRSQMPGRVFASGQRVESVREWFMRDSVPGVSNVPRAIT